MDKFDSVFVIILPTVTDENGFFDARGHNLTTSTGSARRLTLNVAIDRRVGLPLREAPLWGSQGRGYGDDFSSVVMKS